MRYQDYYEPGKEADLRKLCEDCIRFHNECKEKIVPKEIAQKLGLHVDEYSSLVNYIADGGFDALNQLRIEDELSNPGAEFIPDDV